MESTLPFSSPLTSEPMTSDDVAIEEQQDVYQGFFKIQKYKLRHRLFAGGWSDYFDRELFARGSSVGVLLYDPNRDEVVLIRQFRIGALSDPRGPWLIELVAGIVDSSDSDLESVAARETKEETGLIIQKLLPIASYWVSPGGSSERMHLFCAHVDATHANGIHGLSHENEDIQVFAWPYQRAIEALRTGEIDNAATIIALQWLVNKRQD